MFDDTPCCNDAVMQMADRIYDYAAPFATEVGCLYSVIEEFSGDHDMADYCLDCAVIMKGFDAKGVIIDGGWRPDADGCRHCDRCGRMLDCGLTEYGVGEELHHYMHSMPYPLTPEEAMHIFEAIQGAYDHGHVEFQIEALTVGMAALAAVPRLAAPENT